MPRTIVSTPRTLASNRLLVRDMKASFLFDGTTGYIQRDAANVFSASGYSIAFWVKGRRFTDARIYSEGSSSTTTPCLVIGSHNGASTNNALSVFIRNDASTTKLNFVRSTKTVFDNQWHHIIWVDNNGTCALYIDGALDATDFNYTPGGTYTFNRTSFGANVRTSVTNFYSGLARSLKTYAVALTAAQALQLYLTGNISVTPYLEWSGDDGAGTTVSDASGNGRTGTINGAVTYSPEVPAKARTEVNANLIRNGDFEYRPPFTAATTAAGTYIDGTAAGSAMNNLFGSWAIPTGAITAAAEVRFDPTTSRSGSGSLKLSSLDATGKVVVSNGKSGSSPAAADLYPVLPNTSYTFSEWVKTTNAATNSVFSDIRQYSGAISTVVTTSTTKLSGTNDWTLLTTTFTTNANTRYIQLLHRIEVAGNVSSAWFDDIVLKPTTPVTRTIVT